MIFHGRNYHTPVLNLKKSHFADLPGIVVGMGYIWGIGWVMVHNTPYMTSL